MNFNIRQQNVINAKDKNILCLATAGSGKTATLIGRINRLLSDGEDPSLIVAFTFTNQAAKEMRKRLSSNAKDVFIGTIHSYANMICANGGINTYGDIAEERFDKIIEKAVVLSTVYYPRVKYLFVDEFQDTDPLQYSFMQKIPAENRFYIGDERQFIYGFRSATDRFIRELATDDNFKKYFLVENYRNPPNIVKFADEFLNSMTKLSPSTIPIKTKNGFIDNCSFKDAAEELTWTEDWTGWAILCRTNSEIEEAQKYLNSLEIPNVIIKRGDLDLDKMGELLAKNCVKIMTVHACMTGDTIIPTSKGLVPIKKIVEEKDSNIKIFNGKEYSYVKKFIHNPPQKILKITTIYGNQIKISEDHNVIILTEKGMKKIKAKDLTGKEEILIKRGIENYLFEQFPLKQNINEDFDIRAIKYSLPKYLNEELSELIGLITADGTYNSSSIHYIKQYKECVDRFAELIKKCFNKEIIVKKCKDRDAWFAECNSVYILNFLKNNFDGIEPKNKKVSSVILSSSKQNQQAFLRGLFEDGTVELKNNKVDNICLCFKNDEMQPQLQSMMSLLGIPVSFSKRTYNNKTINYLYIYSTGLEIFREKINFISNFKKNRLSTFTQKYDRRNKSKIFKNLFLKYKEKLWITGVSNFWNNLLKNKSLAKEGFFKYYNLLSTEQKKHEIVSYIKDCFENYEIETISLIEESGYEETYCLEMEGEAQFIQNGFLMGNCKGLEFPNVIVIGGKVFNQEERRICYVAATRAMASLYWCPTIRTHKGKAKGTAHLAGNYFNKTEKKTIQF